MMEKEEHFQLLRLLQNNPNLSQRQLAKEMGISLGKTNYCLKALLDKGLVKASNFKNSSNKRGYIYQLTPKGIAEKAKATKQFLARKQKEYDMLTKEIAQLEREIKGS